MEEIILKLSKIIEKKHKNKIIYYIEEIINEETDSYLIDIFEEIKNNINNNKIEYAYIGVIEIIDYLELNEELSEIYTKYLDYIWRK